MKRRRAAIGAGRRAREPRPGDGESLEKQTSKRLSQIGRSAGAHDDTCDLPGIAEAVRLAAIEEIGITRLQNLDLVAHGQFEFA